VKVAVPLSSVQPAQAFQQSAGKKRGTNATVDVAGEAFDAYVANFEYGNKKIYKVCWTTHNFLGDFVFTGWLNHAYWNLFLPNLLKLL